MKLPPLSLGLSLGVEAAKAVDSESFSIGQAHGYLCKAGAHTPVHALSGRLQAGPGGGIELTVPASLIKGVFDALHEPGAEFVVRNNRTEAAIKVMTKDEVKKIGGIDKITERGHSYNYTLGPIVELPANGDYEKLWAVSIGSENLEDIRKSYGLETSPQLGFYIPVGIKKKNVTKENGVSKLAEDLALNSGAQRFAKYPAQPRPVTQSSPNPFNAAPAPAAPSVHSRSAIDFAKKTKAQQDLASAVSEYTQGLRGQFTPQEAQSSVKARMANIKSFRDDYRGQLDAPRYTDPAKAKAVSEDQQQDVKATAVMADILSGKPLRSGFKNYAVPALKKVINPVAVPASTLRKAALSIRGQILNGHLQP